MLCYFILVPIFSLHLHFLKVMFKIVGAKHFTPHTLEKVDYDKVDTYLHSLVLFSLVIEGVIFT